MFCLSIVYLYIYNHHFHHHLHQLHHEAVAVTVADIMDSKNIVLENGKFYIIRLTTYILRPTSISQLEVTRSTVHRA